MAFANPRAEWRLWDGERTVPFPFGPFPFGLSEVEALA
jgi:hypothetical protein